MTAFLSMEQHLPLCASKRSRVRILFLLQDLKLTQQSGRPQPSSLFLDSERSQTPNSDLGKCRPVHTAFSRDSFFSVQLCRSLLVCMLCLPWWIRHGWVGSLGTCIVFSDSSIWSIHPRQPSCPLSTCTPILSIKGWFQNPFQPRVSPNTNGEYAGFRSFRKEFRKQQMSPRCRCPPELRFWPVTWSVVSSVACYPSSLQRMKASLSGSQVHMACPVSLLCLLLFNLYSS